jgi:nicotinamidase-related amidase
MTAPDRSALLIIECQRGVVGDLSVLPDLASAAQPVLERIGRLASAARDLGATVVHLTYSPIAAGRSMNQRSPLSQATQSTASWGPEHPGGDVVPVIGVATGDLVFERHQGLSPVHRTETLAVLRNMGIDEVVLAGVSTNLALPAVAVAASDEDFSVVVVRDGSIGVPESHHQSILRHSLAFVARVATVDEIVAGWRSASSTPRVQGRDSLSENA